MREAYAANHLYAARRPFVQGRVFTWHATAYAGQGGFGSLLPLIVPLWIVAIVAHALKKERSAQQNYRADLMIDRSGQTYYADPRTGRRLGSEELVND